MTETSDDGNYLVRVRAQVMTRDESSGGWVPLSGGGLANVSVRKRTSNNNNNNNSNNQHGSSPPSLPKKTHEYLIYGKRISDQSVVLSCTIKKDFEYNKVMPTFHHWRTGEKKFGLTFQTAADARAFDKGVRTAVEELLEGLTAQSNLTAKNGREEGEEDVFMALHLPMEQPESNRQPKEATKGVILRPNYHNNSDHVDSYKSINNGSTPLKMSLPHPQKPSSDLSNDNYPYVQLTTTMHHDYLYPVIDDQKRPPLDRSNSGGSLKKPDILVTQPTKNNMNKRNIRLRCKHCQELYSEQFNPRGACEYAPDPVKRGIATISCLSCAQCMLYHCMSDAEGDFSQNPCSCSTEEGCGRRWFGLALLSIIVPCLWIYPPLRAVHWCGTSCRMCGGRHHPME